MIRLLELSSQNGLSLKQFGDDEITPPYAILSHTWGKDGDEVTFEDIGQGVGRSKIGYDKIRFCGEQANKDGLQYFWVDTCNIDKSSSSELQEAITSMFRWYRDAAKCYVYLSDVSFRKRKHERKRKRNQEETWEAAFRQSRWFTRGWTLQELLAPKSVEFFSKEKEFLGGKNTLERQIHEITKIPIAALNGCPLSRFSVHERMRWAANRNTKRKEDRAYCLLGIFDVSMPLIYGEGEKAFMRLEEEIDKCMKAKLDLNKLPCAKGATFNSYDQDHTTCHPATRVDLLGQIQNWALNPHSKSIFWLNGMAGTGKSTISWTFAQWLEEQAHLGAIDLGASFFFKRGAGDRGNASRFFSTITRGLLLKVEELDNLISEVTANDPFIAEKALGEQFKRLIYEPLQKVNIDPSRCRTLIVVVDALDECEKARDVGIILELWSQLPRIKAIRVKLFLTSRPELPIRLGFKDMSDDAHQDFILHEVPRPTIRQDLFLFLKDRFSKIRKQSNVDSLFKLDSDWPGNNVLHALVDLADPLFIVAATVCRFVGDPFCDPQEQIKAILHYQKLGQLEQMEQTYLPVLQQLPARGNQSSDKIYKDFQLIVGSIVVLAEPLSISSLAVLLNEPPHAIGLCLRPLHAVLAVPSSLESPVRPLHLSFSEFLTSEKLRDQPFGVNSPTTHQLLFKKCLELLSGRDGLQEDLCDLRHPGQLRQDIDSAIIGKRLSPALQYACRYWVYHAKHSKVQVYNDDEVHVFLQDHFLHWVEALSLMNRIAEVIEQIGVLQSIVSANNSDDLFLFLEDARRFILANRYVADLAPLQIYSSAIVFAPQQSKIRNVCGQIPKWIQICPITPARWGSELQKLEGHDGPVNAVAFSPEGSQLASGSDDGTIRFWEVRSGQEMHVLNGHTDAVSTVAFSPDGSLLASGSRDYTIRLWNAMTGCEVRTLKGHSAGISKVVFSPRGLQLASGSHDGTIKFWEVKSGQEMHVLNGHTNAVSTVAFSPDGSLLASGSRDYTIRLWNATTGREVRTLKGHHYIVSEVAFSPKGTLLVSGAYDGMVKLWDTTTGQEVWTLKDGVCVLAVAFSPDGALLASTSTSDTVRVWDVATSQNVYTLRGHSGCVGLVVFSPDGSLLASGSEDSTVRLWGAATSHQVPALGGHTDKVHKVVFSSDGALLASGSRDNTARLWDTASGREVHTLRGHTEQVNEVVFSPNGSLLASGSNDGTARLWDTATGQEVHILNGHTNIVNAVSFSPDGSLLASGSNDHTIRLWDTTTGQEVHKLDGHTDLITAVMFSPSGSLLASVSYDGTDRIDHTIRLWDTATGREVHTLKNPIGFLRALAFSPDGTLLALGLYDGTIRLWDIAIGQEVRTFNGHTGKVLEVAFSPDGSLLASSSSDVTIRLWNMATGQEEQKFENILWVHDIHLTIDNGTIFINRGVIQVHDRPGSNAITQSPERKSKVIRKDWIQQNNRNLLWLPEEYRSTETAFYNDTWAFGLTTGLVCFLKVDYS